MKVRSDFVTNSSSSSFIIGSDSDIDTTEDLYTLVRGLYINMYEDSAKVIYETAYSVLLEGVKNSSYSDEYPVEDFIKAYSELPDVRCAIQESDGTINTEYLNNVLKVMTFLTHCEYAWIDKIKRRHGLSDYALSWDTCNDWLAIDSYEEFSKIPGKPFYIKDYRVEPCHDIIDWYAKPECASMYELCHKNVKAQEGSWWCEGCLLNIDSKCVAIDINNDCRQYKDSSLVRNIMSTIGKLGVEAYEGESLPCRIVDELGELCSYSCNHMG